MPSISVTELQNIELLAGFQQSELDELASHLSCRDCEAGAIIFSAGETGRSLFIVLSGRVEIDLIGRVVNETELAELGPRDVFGESTFFHAASHIATARCLEATRLAELSYSAYESLLKNGSTMAYHLGANAAHILAARLQSTDAWIREILDQDEELHRRQLQQRYHEAFHPSFTTPVGFVGVGANW